MRFRRMTRRRGRDAKKQAVDSRSWDRIATGRVAILQLILSIPSKHKKQYIPLLRCTHDWRLLQLNLPERYLPGATCSMIFRHMSRLFMFFLEINTYVENVTRLPHSADVGAGNISYLNYVPCYTNAAKALQCQFHTRFEFFCESCMTFKSKKVQTL